MKLNAVLLTSLLALVISGADAQVDVRPPGSAVPNSAVAIARATLTPIFGAKMVTMVEPLSAARAGDIWQVSSRTFCTDARIQGVDPCFSLVLVELSAVDGRVSFVRNAF